jgi:hypothetical protein
VDNFIWIRTFSNSIFMAQTNTMTTIQITNRISEINALIMQNLKSGNSVENAAKWAQLVKERSELKNRL